MGNLRYKTGFKKSVKKKKNISQLLRNILYSTAVRRCFISVCVSVCVYQCKYVNECVCAYEHGVYASSNV